MSPCSYDMYTAFGETACILTVSILSKNVVQLFPKSCTRNRRNRVNELQDTRSRAAKQSLDRKFGALYDKMYRSDGLWEAWLRVRKNKGAAGVDGQSIEYLEEVIEAVPFLKALQEELRSQD